MLATGLHSAHFERQGESGDAEWDETEREVLHMTNDRPWGITQGGKTKGGARGSRGAEVAPWSPRTLIITYKMQLSVSSAFKGFVPHCC